MDFNGNSCNEQYSCFEFGFVIKRVSIGSMKCKYYHLRKYKCLQCGHCIKSVKPIIASKNTLITSSTEQTTQLSVSNITDVVGVRVSFDSKNDQNRIYLNGAGGFIAVNLKELKGMDVTWTHHFEIIIILCPSGYFSPLKYLQTVLMLKNKNMDI